MSVEILLTVAQLYKKLHSDIGLQTLNVLEGHSMTNGAI